MKINVYYSIDGGGKNYMMCFLSVISLCETNKNNEITIYLLDGKYEGFCDKMSDKQLGDIKRYVTSTNPNNKVVHIDVSDLLITKFKRTKKNWNGAPKPLIWTRHLLPYIDVEWPEKLLWLDSDTLVLKDLSKLFATDISNVAWAGCREYFFNFTRSKVSKQILQNGVMLLNTKKVITYMHDLVARERKLKVMDDMIEFNKITFFDRKTLNDVFNNYGNIDQDTYIFHVCGVYCQCPHNKIKFFFEKLMFKLILGSKFIKRLDKDFAFKYGNNICLSKYDVKVCLYETENKRTFFPQVSNKRSHIKSGDEEKFLLCYPQFKYVYDIFHKFTD